MKFYDFSEEDIQQVIRDIHEGRGISLGQHLYKIRASAKGQGKRGGFRIIFFWKMEKHVIFCHLFSKSDKDNLNYKEMKALHTLAQEYETLTETDIENMLTYERLKEVIYDQTKGNIQHYGNG